MGEQEREIAYEREGALTVCPCCGGDARHRGWSCDECWHKTPFDIQKQVEGVYMESAHSRAIMHDLGARLRAEGKMPPLKTGASEQRYGIWCVGPVYPGGVWYGAGKAATWTREEAESRVAFLRADPDCAGHDYEVRPYLDQAGEAIHYSAKMRCTVNEKELRDALEAMTLSGPHHRHPAAEWQAQSIDVAALARALHATDLRVKELVQRKGDGIDAEAVWLAGKKGSLPEAQWMAEAVLRASQVAEWMAKPGDGK